MENGKTAQEALNDLISQDDGASVRQVAMIDVKEMLQPIQVVSVSMRLAIKLEKLFSAG
ncbi:hypothetical protein Ct9H90mP29_18030 [bacterium]|nr:MAG: hypothetical protein Ct9H90mP29_18030 [bacterium]